MIDFNVSKMPVLSLLVMIPPVVLIPVLIRPGRFARNIVLGKIISGSDDSIDATACFASVVRHGSAIERSPYVSIGVQIWL